VESMFGKSARGRRLPSSSKLPRSSDFSRKLIPRAPNSSHCEWSPDGRYIMTATLSPRLRVDNGVKIWWCGGQLLHIHLQDELYSAAFQPSLVQNTPAFPSVLPAAPEPNASVALHRPKGDTSNGRKSFTSGVWQC
jgi:translation initiation factor 2A